MTMRVSAIAASLVVSLVVLAGLPAQAQDPFPAGAKAAFINPPRVFEGSIDGKAAKARIDALAKEKPNDTAAMNALQSEVQDDFVKKVTPVIQQMCREKGLQ